VCGVAVRQAADVKSCAVSVAGEKLSARVGQGADSSAKKSVDSGRGGQPLARLERAGLEVRANAFTRSVKGPQEMPRGGDFDREPCEIGRRLK
jgi:hypothetical protein